MKTKKVSVPALEFKCGDDVKLHLRDCGFQWPVIVRDRRLLGRVWGIRPDLIFTVKMAKTGAIGMGHDRNGRLVITYANEEFKQQYTMLYYLLHGTNVMVSI